MDVNHALEYGRSIKNVYPRLLTLQTLGLGYLMLSEETTSLSGGEEGGCIAACFTSDEIKRCAQSITGPFI